MINASKYLRLLLITSCLICLSFVHQLSGQTVEQLIDDGATLFDNEAFDKAERKFKHACALAIQQKNEYAQMRAIIWKSECAFQRQSFEDFQQLSYDAKKIADKKFSKDTLYFVILQNIGVSHSYLGRYDLQRKYYFKALDFVESNFPDNDKMLTDAFYNIAAVYYRRFALDSAIIWSDSTLTLAQKIGYKELEAKMYLNRGVIYSRHNDFNQAIKQQTKGLQLTTNTNDKILGQTHLANYYNIIGKKEDALKHLNIALDLVKTTGKHQQYHAMVALNACRIFLQHQDTVAFLNTWNNLNHWLPSNDINFEADRKRALNLMAQYHIGKKQYQQAKHALNKALTVHNKKEYPETKTWSLKLYAQLLAEQGLFEQSLQKTQQALFTITPAFLADEAFDAKQINRNPAPNEIFVFEQSLELLSSKMNTFMDWSKASADPSHLQQALLVFECVDSFLTLNRQQLKTRQSKTTLASLIHPFFQASLDLFHALYNEDNNPIWIQEAFRVMERGRALIISENLVKQSALKANIPDSLQLKEKKLAKQSDYLNFLIEQADGVEGADNKRAEWQEQRFSIEKEWSELLNQLARDFPNYYAQNYQLAFSSVKDVQENLISDKELILSFMDVDTYLYCIGISKKAVFFKKILLDQPLEEQIIALRTSTLKHKNSFYDQSHQLYTQILAPISSKIAHKDLIIMPDGWLWKLPFAALVSNKPQAHQSTFLIEQNRIRYWHAAHSALLFKERNTNFRYQYNCTAFAPFCYEGQEQKEAYLPVLPGSLSEIKTIEKLFPKPGFKLYLDKDAHTDNFLDGIQSSQIIHVNSHTNINDDYPGLSSLYFYKTQDSLKNNQVHVYDLYQKEMHAELAILSTCRSGDDKIEKGEGLAGLSRVFTMAGCPNIIVSQWPLNDQSSAKIMVDFYKNLLAGQGKNDALTNAQQNYLKTSSPLDKHPYYWAGLIHIGDNKAVDFEDTYPANKTYSYLTLIGLLLIVFSLIYWFFFKRLGFGRGSTDENL